MLQEGGFRQGRLRVQDGLEMAYRDYPPLEPAGRHRLPLLCLAGITRNSSDFHVPAQRWRRRRRVIAPDLRGRGLSERDPTGRSYRPEVYVADLHALCCALGVGRAVLCGTSLGAFLIMGMAVLLPTLVQAAILNDASPVIDPELIRGLRRNAEPLTRLRPADHAAAKAFLKQTLPHIGLTLESDWDQLTLGTYRPGPDGRLQATWDPKLVGSLSGAPPEERLWPLFAALRAKPLLLVRGGRSDFVTDATLARMQALHPGMAQVTVPGAGHSPTLKEPETADVIDRFLEEHAP